GSSSFVGAVNAVEIGRRDAVVPTDPSDQGCVRELHRRVPPRRAAGRAEDHPRADRSGPHSVPVRGVSGLPRARDRGGGPARAGGLTGLHAAQLVAPRAAVRAAAPSRGSLVACVLYKRLRFFWGVWLAVAAGDQHVFVAALDQITRFLGGL